ncbi:MAG: hypothetical protein IPH04_13540 [Saprospirales bacterium]|jgi:cell division protein FtsQ|nr:hypothetical protein [Saprospirales bacterium]MBK6903785.1 hypothetical protein [Saprospirales bacterium]MBK7335922.1 hypothetical protein [Saprospirales bacterium]
MSPELIKTLKRLGYFLAFFTAAIVILAAVEKKKDSGATGIKIDVEPLPDGHYLIDSSDIKKTIQRSFAFEWTGQQIGLLNIERLERVLEEDPFIFSADVFINAKNKIHIKIRQREPVLRIIDDNGLHYYIDIDGNKMPLSKHFSARVMVATGSLPPHVPGFLDRKKHLLKDVFLLSRYIEEDRFLRTLIEQIYVSNGKILLAPKIGSHKIILGSMDGIEEKFKRLRLFYDEVTPYEGWRRYRTVNLSYKGQIVCEKR